MKKLLLTLFAGSLLFVVSCGDDDGDGNGGGNVVGLNGTVTYDGSSYSIENGILNLGQSEGNAEGQFFIADGTLTVSGSNSVSTSDSQIIIVMTATSKGTSSLENGDYATSTDVPDLHVDLAVTTFDGDSQVRREAFTNGTVTISGSEDTYTVTFDAPFGSGIELTGSVDGTYVTP